MFEEALSSSLGSSACLQLSKFVTLFIKAIKEVLSAGGYNYEIVVNDRNPDDIYHHLLTMCKDGLVKAFKLPRNVGRGFALLYGFKHS